MDSLEARIAGIYAQQEPHILPYIGAAFTQPEASDLRVMAVGINAYYCEESPPAPSAYRHIFATSAYHYQTAVLHAADLLSTGLAQQGALFEGRVFDKGRSVYGTNAVKVWMPAARGKQAVQLDEADFARHVDQWYAEIDALRAANVLPHVVIVFGKPFWETAWQTFHPDHHGSERGVEQYTAAWGDAPHRANRIVVRCGAGRHSMLLVRLRHPAGRSADGSAEWLLEREAFRELCAVKF